MKIEDLLFPIYLDVPMITSFLASIQGGYVDETNIETKESESSKISNELRANFGVKVLNFFNSNVDGKNTNDLSNLVESKYTTNVKYPQASLFIGLRNTLVQENMLRTISDLESLNKVNIGEIVEFSGTVRPDAAYSLRNAFNQLIPIVEPVLTSQRNEYQQHIDMISKVNKQNIIQLNDNESINEKNKGSYLQKSKHLLNTAENSLNQLKLMKELIDSMFPIQNQFSNIIVEDSDRKLVCQIQKDYTRHNRIADLYNSNWRVMGKVIGIIQEGDTFDLLSESPLAYFDKSMFEKISHSMNNEKIKIPVIDSIITGKSLIVIPIAMFQ